jgi:hypothetical protein
MTIATDEARSALIEMARVWSRLADEQITALPIPIAKDNQRVIQQQQQQQAPAKKDGD